VDKVWIIDGMTCIPREKTFGTVRTILL